jgi:hypothetical protein
MTTPPTDPPLAHDAGPNDDRRAMNPTDDIFLPRVSYFADDV